MSKALRVFLTKFCLFITLSLPVGISSNASAQTPSGFELLGRGVNYGNMLEGPSEGEWGVRFNDRFPRLVKDAGFDHVRLPVRWSSHMADTAPYQIHSAFLERVRHIVNANLEVGLKVVLNVHHFDELYESPDAQRERFLALWRQLADEFAGAGDGLVLEILNEPHANLGAEEWNPLLVDALNLIRKQHPDRWVVVGPPDWNGIDGLPKLELPQDDRHLIVTVHYYLPFDFTHQGAGWVTPVRPTGIKWTGTDAERSAIENDMQKVSDWAKENSRPIYVGEFGAFERADMESRVAWTAAVRQSCEAKQFGWAYWELAAGFGILDQETIQWKMPLVEALVPEQ
jgi:endoglucanase